eukprot:jgi/Botrbrau1/22289/Bobra.0138s0042.1
MSTGGLVRNFLGHALPEAGVPSPTKASSTAAKWQGTIASPLHTEVAPGPHVPCKRPYHTDEAQETCVHKRRRLEHTSSESTDQAPQALAGGEMLAQNRAFNVDKTAVRDRQSPEGPDAGLAALAGLRGHTQSVPASPPPEHDGGLIGIGEALPGGTEVLDEHFRVQKLLRRLNQWTLKHKEHPAMVAGFIVEAMYSWGKKNAQIPPCKPRTPCTLPQWGAASTRSQRNAAQLKTARDASKVALVGQTSLELCGDAEVFANVPVLTTLGRNDRSTLEGLAGGAVPPTAALQEPCVKSSLPPAVAIGPAEGPTSGEASASVPGILLEAAAGPGTSQVPGKSLGGWPEAELREPELEGTEDPGIPRGVACPPRMLECESPCVGDAKQESPPPLHDHERHPEDDERDENRHLSQNDDAEVADAALLSAREGRPGSGSLSPADVEICDTESFSEESGTDTSSSGSEWEEVPVDTANSSGGLARAGSTPPPLPEKAWRSDAPSSIPPRVLLQGQTTADEASASPRPHSGGSIARKNTVVGGSARRRMAGGTAVLPQTGAVHVAVSKCSPASPEGGSGVRALGDDAAAGPPRVLAESAPSRDAPPAVPRRPAQGQSTGDADASTPCGERAGGARRGGAALERNQRTLQAAIKEGSAESAPGGSGHPGIKSGTPAAMPLGPPRGPAQGTVGTGTASSMSQGSGKQAAGEGSARMPVTRSRSPQAGRGRSASLSESHGIDEEDVEGGSDDVSGTEEEENSEAESSSEEESGAGDSDSSSEWELVAEEPIGITNQCGRAQSGTVINKCSRGGTPDCCGHVGS